MAAGNCSDGVPVLVTAAVAVPEPILTVSVLEQYWNKDAAVIRHTMTPVWVGFIMAGFVRGAGFIIYQIPYLSKTYAVNKNLSSVQRF